MQTTNPVFIPRNYILQEAIDDLEQGKNEKLESIWQACQTPYELNEKTKPYYKLAPEWSKDRAGCSTLSCSS